MPLLLYPNGWKNLAAYFEAMVQQTGLAAADVADRLERDRQSQWFELRTHIQLGHADHVSASKIELGAHELWVMTSYGPQEAVNFELRRSQSYGPYVHVRIPTPVLEVIEIDEPEVPGTPEEQPAMPSEAPAKADPPTAPSETPLAAPPEARASTPPPPEWFVAITPHFDALIKQPEDRYPSQGQARNAVTAYLKKEKIDGRPGDPRTIERALLNYGSRWFINQGPQKRRS